jgi:hypothetical protein
LVWLGVVYGTVDGLLLSVLPVVAAWRALDAAGWTGSTAGRIAAGALALAASLFVTTAYHWVSRVPPGRRLGADLGCGAMGLAFLLSRNPLATTLSHIAMHVAAVCGIDSTVQLRRTGETRLGRADTHPGTKDGRCSTLRATRSASPPSAIDRWAGPGWHLLGSTDHIERLPPLQPMRSPKCNCETSRWWQRSSHRAPLLEEMTLREFFSTLVLEEEAGRSWSSACSSCERRGHQRRTRLREFRGALPGSPFAAIGTFRAEAAEGGARLWTETWARTSGAVPGLLFGAYWLAIGPWSAWIRQMFLRAARDSAERPAPGPS